MHGLARTLHLAFGIFANGTAFFIFLAPIVTFKRIIKKRSTEEFSGLPYVMTLLNCLLCAWYGLPFVSPNNILMTTIDGIGTVIELAFVAIFIVFAPKNEKKKTGSLLILVVGIFVAVALLSVLVFHGRIRQLFCGFAALISTAVMFLSPLSVIWVVMKTKSVEFMPFLLTFSMFLCGTAWFIFGPLEKDPFVYVPNGVGCGVGVLQLILYAIYSEKTIFMTIKRSFFHGMLQINAMPQPEKKQPSIPPSKYDEPV
ncbi:PREDICTED: bidirectional sugar transporter SWEET1-like [Ipomoea nil]|uniref:bidirectional sugar transporter SWEET1-like n=1 Tax=Ipomoea nil TaxID=35883 RepID=UPI000900BB9D|nr:PREDICTED: bidirectional sugar transporter SWEET1-like [Ipomoea nil]